jgi:hypothetical protein
VTLADGKMRNRLAAEGDFCALQASVAASKLVPKWRNWVVSVAASSGVLALLVVLFFLPVKAFSRPLLDT